MGVSRQELERALASQSRVVEIGAKEYAVLAKWSERAAVLLRRIEWAGLKEGGYVVKSCPACPACGERQDDSGTKAGLRRDDGHLPDCELAALLRDVPNA